MDTQAKKTGIRQLKKITVYAGSGPGNDPAFVQAGHDLGQIFCQNDITGVFGGGSIGIMGAFGTSMISHGGNIIAVIPKGLMTREQPIVSNDTLLSTTGYQLLVTEDMYNRKRTFRESDAFIALPGGSGTRDEVWEELTGIQIGEHEKPVVLVNIKGHFDHVAADIRQMRGDGFIRPGLDFDHLFDIVDDVHKAVPAIRRLLGISHVVDIHELRAAG